MCGVCGVIGFDGQGTPPEVEARMLQSLRHRGPDDQGVYRARAGATDVFLGHTRLSILDLSPAARQPISNETGRVWAVFNGEIHFLSCRLSWNH
jgi:asparagine synthase (glutamine-hydrolysing)